MGLEKLIIWDDYLSHALHLDFARRKHAREIKNEVLVKNYNGFVIEGSENFIKRTVLALEKIQDGASEEYNVIQNNLGKIKLNEYSGMVAYDSPPTFLVGPTAFEKTRLYALAIVHDAYHSKLYQDYKRQHPEERVIPNEIYSGRKVEIECNKFADLVNKKMKGSFLFKWLNKQDTLFSRMVPHENVPLKNRCW